MAKKGGAKEGTVCYLPTYLTIYLSRYIGYKKKENGKDRGWEQIYYRLHHISDLLYEVRARRRNLRRREFTIPICGIINSPRIVPCARIASLWGIASFC